MFTGDDLAPALLAWLTDNMSLSARSRTEFHVATPRLHKKGGKEEEIDVDAVESGCKKQTCHCTAM